MYIIINPGGINLHTENKKCTFCGEDIGYSLRRCPYCGSLLGDSVNNPNPLYNERQVTGNDVPDMPTDGIEAPHTDASVKTENRFNALDNYERELNIDRLEPENNQGVQEKIQNPSEQDVEKPNVTNENTSFQGASLNRENHNSGNPYSFESNTNRRPDSPVYSGYQVNPPQINRLSNNMKVFLTVVSTIPWIGQLIGIISAIVFMNSEYDADRKSFGLALLIASISLFVIVSCIGCFIGMGLTENKLYY
jgi:hypothetical protein